MSLVTFLKPFLFHSFYPNKDDNIHRSSARKNSLKSLKIQNPPPIPGIFTPPEKAYQILGGKTINNVMLGVS